MPMRKPEDLSAKQMGDLQSERSDLAHAKVLKIYDDVDQHARERIGKIQETEDQLGLVMSVATLLEKGRSKWTPAEQQIWDDFSKMKSDIEAIRSSAESIKQTPGGVPSDYRDDSHWPKVNV